MIKKALQIGDYRVRLKSKSVNPREITSKKIKNVIKNLVDSMHHYNLVGMAAPQLGINLNVFISEIRKTAVRTSVITDPLRIFINPKIVRYSQKKKDMIEGCGTVDYGNLFGPVKRSLSIKVEAQNEKGENFVLEATGLLAQIIQHEYDHLQGVLCIDKFSNTRKIFHKELKGRKIKK